ncbi:MAG TPA: thioesterase family protein [Methylomirabilota bacterium]|nr:thioesterase family protein [Methylomirabilota bacterium]
MPIQAGLTAEVEKTVTPELTADALGNKGVRVLATPFVLSLMELASHEALVPHLPPGAGTVGTTVDMKHLAATPVGMKVRAKATVLETDGKRCLFQVEVFDEVEKVAEARHERFIVPNLEKFLERAMKKSKP